MKYDVIVIGSGAGGSAAAFHLTQTGKRVLLLEKGLALPRDGSTLDVDKVLRKGAFLSDEPWVDGKGQMTVPEEHFNLGGKTKWYGAALLRFAPHEFDADPAHQCPRVAVRSCDAGAVLRGSGAAPRRAPLRGGAQHAAAGRRTAPAGSAVAQGSSSRWVCPPTSSTHPNEARHFDGFASVRGLKATPKGRCSRACMNKPNLEVLTGKAVATLIPAAGDATRIAGVVCEDGSRYTADTVVLAAGALHSPRLLADLYREQRPRRDAALLCATSAATTSRTC